mgnify:CR=1 FL=1
MRIIYLGIIVTMFSALASAENVTVYRWVDKNNVVHFSQHQPAHDNYTEMSLANISEPKIKKEITPVNDELIEPIVITASTEKCEEAKANIRTLKAYDKIQFTDANGKVQLLDKETKKLQLEINETQLKFYCSK